MQDYSTFEFLIVEVHAEHLVLQLNRGKANALNQQMIDELSCFFKQALADDEVGGVVLIGKDHFFSGGVDLTEVYYYHSEAVKHFWGSFLQLASQMLDFSKPLVAAISGHSPAGGCIMALTCDYRIMATGEKYQIGLNEIAVGIAPRASILQLYRSLIGPRKAYQYLLEGKLLSPQKALEDGLVDALAELKDLKKQAQAKMETYLKLPRKAFRQTKAILRQELIQSMQKNQDAELDKLHQQLMSKESKLIMGQLVEYLKSSKK
jgi:enoyl-CoA hydratase/carnithine racemase